MKLPVLRISLGLLTSALALPGLPQAITPQNSQDILSATLADLRGIDETIERSGAEKRVDRSVLWFSLINDPRGSVALPAARPSAGTISAKRLRHRPPKAAQAAYDKATRIKDDNKAAKELEKAVALDSDFAEAHGNLGVAYARLGRNPEAAAEFRRVMELAPGESLPYSHLAWVLFAMGQRAEAEASVRRALELWPDNVAARFLMGRLLIENPQTLAEGRGHLEYAARTIPEAKKLVKALNRK